MVNHGALPELARASHLRGVGLRADWHVRQLKPEHRQVDYARAGPGRARAGYPGKVLRCFEIERMSRWDDDRDTANMARYLLDVTPLRAS
jgi:hypothetical protein